MPGLVPAPATPVASNAEYARAYRDAYRAGYLPRRRHTMRATMIVTDRHECGVHRGGGWVQRRVSASASGVFLAGQWRYLAMLNYRVDPALLEPLVPRGTTLDHWHGTTYVSLVGFLFRDTRVLGVPVPLHRSFEEVNLRFYVRRETDGEVRRGVTFIREIVPRAAIALVARLTYNEPYVALPMRHAIAAHSVDEAPSSVRYEWRQRPGWSALTVSAGGIAIALAPGSEAEFITEHYWGYTRQRDGGTVEYHVTHPRWRTWTVNAATVQGDLAELYGASLGDVLRRHPDSAFLAEGSAIEVHAPSRLTR